MLNMTDPIQVAAGLIFREGRLLITQRPAGGHLEGHWEFPGGKCEPGETMPECLQRELHEELGITTTIGRRVESISHVYPEKSVELEFFLCTIAAGEPKGFDGQNIAWVSVEELDGYEFPAADARLLQRVKTETNWWTGWSKK